MTQFFAVKSQSHLTNSLKGLLLVILSFVTSSGLTQGWELSFGGVKEDSGNKVIQTQDGGYVVAGSSESFGSDNDLDVYVVRTDVDGTELWSEVFDEGINEHGYSIIQTEDNGFLIVGDIQFPAQFADVYLLKISAEGKLEWSRTYGDPDAFDTGRDIIKAIDGGFLIVGHTKATDNGEDDILVIKIDDEGNEIWSKTYGTDRDDLVSAVVALEEGYAFVGNTTNPTGTDKDIVLSHIDSEGAEVWSRYISTDQAEEAYDLVRTQDGNIVITGYQGFSNDLLLAKYSADGDSLWTKIEDTYGEGEVGQAIIETAEGTLAVTGLIEISDSNVDVLIATFNADGGDFWFTNIGNDGRVDYGLDITNTMDGGYIVAGFNSLITTFFNDLTLLKTDGAGNVLTNFIEGHVFVDVDEDCPGTTDPDFGDIGLEDWIVKVKGENNTYFGTTDENGFYSILVDTGSYNVSVLIPNAYWGPCEDGEYDLPTITDFYTTETANFPILPAIECPYLEVDVSANWDVVPGCFDAEYTIKYGNMGTTTAEAAYVEVTLDEDLTYNGSSIVPSETNGNIYTFQVGDLISLERGSFTIQTSVDCDVELLQASVVSAHIYPDTNCIPLNPDWDEVSIEVDGECLTDSIKFEIRNVGEGDMMDSLQFIVVEDHILFLVDSFRLDFDGMLERKFPITGSTYRIIAEQSEYHPGNNYPTIAIEGCIVDEEDEYTTGHVAEFPENDQDPFISIDVQEIFGSGLPVEMRGYPKGYKDSLIAANTDINYLISFSNVGTDTINRIVIRDTLSAHLDIESIIPGTSSHPYNFEVYGNGILKITLSDIQLLPGGSAEEASTRGFVKFRIAQKPDNPLSTKINNSAAIFFNFDAPVQTNVVSHVIGDFPEVLDTIIVSNNEVFLPGLEIKIYPNPFTESTTFELLGRDFETVDFTILDLTGRVIKRDQFRGNQFHFYRNHLPSGLFIYKLESEGRLINSGKILVR